MMSLAPRSFRGAMNSRSAVALGALGLLALLIMVGNAQARDVYCAPDSEASNLNGGFNDQITGDMTKLYRDSETPSGEWETDWSGPIQQCDPNAADGCVFRLDKGESYTKTTVKGFSAGLGATGGANPVPFPVGMFNFSVNKSKTEAWNVANQTTANAGDRKRPVVKHEWLKVEGHYTGAYKYQGEQENCHAYVLDPNHTFGHWTALVAAESVQTWEPA
jgi:hypothetical protein